MYSYYWKLFNVKGSCLDSFEQRISSHSYPNAPARVPEEISEVFD